MSYQTNTKRGGEIKGNNLVMPELAFGNKFMFVEDVWLDVKQDNLASVRNLILTEYLTIGVSVQMIKYYWLLAMEQWLGIKSQIITTTVSSILIGIPIFVAFTKLSKYQS